MSGSSRLPLFAGLMAVVGVAGLLSAALVSNEPQVRGAALVGVAEALFSGVVALELKRRALARSLTAARAVVGVMFLLRLVLVMAGVVVVTKALGWSGVAFTVGFFAEYFGLQWIEVAYVLAEAKRRGQGGV